MLLIPFFFLQVCQNVPQPPGVSPLCSIAQAAATAPASTAASVTSTSTGSSRTWGPGWGRGLQALGPRRAPPDSGWATGWSQAASPAREAPASRATATQQGIAASPAPATRAGRGHCVTSKSTTPVMATSECFCSTAPMCGGYRIGMSLKPQWVQGTLHIFNLACLSIPHPQVYPWHLPSNQLLLLLVSLPARLCWRALWWAGPGCG